jgi:hypothetical protein
MAVTSLGQCVRDSSDDRSGITSDVAIDSRNAASTTRPNTVSVPLPVCAAAANAVIGAATKHA